MRIGLLIVGLMLAGCTTSPSPSPVAPSPTAPSTTAPAPVATIQPTTSALVTDRLGRLSIAHPESWRYVAGPPPVEGGYVPLFYLTNVAVNVSPCPTRDPATDVFDGCPPPLVGLPVQGVLVTVFPNGGLAAIVPPEVSVSSASDACLAIAGDRQVFAVVGAVVVTACIRGPDLDAAVQEVEAAIASITGAS